MYSRDWRLGNCFKNTNTFPGKKNSTKASSHTIEGWQEASPRRLYDSSSRKQNTCSNTWHSPSLSKATWPSSGYRGQCWRTYRGGNGALTHGNILFSTKFLFVHSGTHVATRLNPCVLSPIMHWRYEDLSSLPALIPESYKKQLSHWLTHFNVGGEIETAAGQGPVLRITRQHLSIREAAQPKGRGWWPICPGSAATGLSTGPTPGLGPPPWPSLVGSFVARRRTWWDKAISDQAAFLGKTRKRQKYALNPEKKCTQPILKPFFPFRNLFIYSLLWDWLACWTPT